MSGIFDSRLLLTSPNNVILCLNVFPTHDACVSHCSQNRIAIDMYTSSCTCCYAVDEMPPGSGPMAFALAKAGVTLEMFPEVGATS